MMNVKILVFYCSSVAIALLVACNSIEQKSDLTGGDWVNNEILEQLIELRKEVHSLKADIAGLDNKIYASRNGGNVVKAPEEINIEGAVEMGDSEAQIAIIEFTDYQCPFCARHYKKVMPRIRQELIETGKVRYYTYEYPLEFHAQAKSASVAARCADEQGKYWEMHDVLFNNQAALSDSLYMQAVNSLKLDKNEFVACLNNPDMEAKVDSSIKLGNEAGVTGTPKFYVGVVNGHKLERITVISGAQPYDAFRRAVDQL